MDYISTIHPQKGINILYETYNIKVIHLMQQVQLNDRKGIFYLVVIEYNDGSREQTILSNESWEAWNKWKNEGATDENKSQ